MARAELDFSVRRVNLWRQLFLVSYPLIVVHQLCIIHFLPSLGPSHPAAGPSAAGMAVEDGKTGQAVDERVARTSKTVV